MSLNILSLDFDRKLKPTFVRIMLTEFNWAPPDLS